MPISDLFFAHKFKFETTSFQYFSQRIPKIKKVWTLDFRKWGKNTFKRYLTKLYLRMYRQTDILTYRKNQPRWPTLWKRTNLFWQYRMKNVGGLQRFGIFQKAVLAQGGTVTNRATPSCYYKMFTVNNFHSDYLIMSTNSNFSPHFCSFTFSDTVVWILFQPIRVVSFADRWRWFSSFSFSLTKVSKYFAWQN